MLVVCHGAKIDGGLALGTDNALGGNSITLGDNDTGIKVGIDVNYSFYMENWNCPAAHLLIFKMAVFYRSARDGS